MVSRGRFVRCVCLVVVVGWLLGVAVVQAQAPPAGLPEPPPRLVVEVEPGSHQVSGAGTGNVFVDLWMAFRLSPDDDQSVPVFNYSFYMRGWLEGSDWVLLGTGSPVLLKEGWGWPGHLFPVFVNHSAVGDVREGLRPGDVEIAWTALNTSSGAESGLSCVARITITRLEQDLNLVQVGNPTRFNAGDQCGEPALAPPEGLSGIVVQGRNRDAGTPSVVRLRTTVSPDDPSPDTGSLELYWLPAVPASRMEEVGGFFERQFAEFPIGRTDWVNVFPDIFGWSPPRNATAGLYTDDFETFLSSTQVVRVVVRDNVTREQSEHSCLITLDFDRALSMARCGEVSLVGAPVPSDEPQFLGLDLIDSSNATGIPFEQMAWLLGGVLVMGAAVLGYLIGRVLGAALLAPVGYVLALHWNLFPRWTAAVVFVAAAGFLVMNWAAGRRS